MMGQGEQDDAGTHGRKTQDARRRRRTQDAGRKTHAPQRNEIDFMT